MWYETLAKLGTLIADGETCSFLSFDLADAYHALQIDPAYQKYFGFILRVVLVFGSKLVSCDAAGLPFGMVSEPRRRLEPTPAGSLVEFLAVKMYFRVSAEFLELC